jgi:hypothetical protein
MAVVNKISCIVKRVPSLESKVIEAQVSRLGSPRSIVLEVDDATFQSVSSHLFSQSDLVVSNLHLRSSTGKPQVVEVVHSLKMAPSSSLAF